MTCKLIKLHLGCGKDHRRGWVNVDANKRCKPDVLSPAHRLPMFKNNTVDIIEACHLLEHLTYYQALDALKEWHRILRSKGQLFLELPNFTECVRLLGKHKEPQCGFDLALVGIFGHPPMVRDDGLFQTHKWGWTKTALTQQLLKAGFSAIVPLPITQTWRVAAKTTRDMRLGAHKK